MRRWPLSISPRPPWRLLPHSRLICSAAAADSLLFFLTRCSDLKTLWQAHGFMVTRGFDHDNLFLGKFIDACSSLGHVHYAYSVFTHQCSPNTYLHNTMIRAFSLTDDPATQAKAVLIYKNIRASCLNSDTYSVPFVLKAVLRLSDVWVGRQVHCQTVISGLDSDFHVVAGLIQVYSSCACLEDARKVFDETHIRDSALWNAVITGYAKAGEVDEARVLLETMPSCLRNVVSWTSVIYGYVQIDRPIEAIEAFRRMQIENVEPDEVAILAALSACADMGAFQLGEWIQRFAENRGLNPTITLNNALIDMYAKSGNISKALKVFEKMNNRSIVTWTTMIHGLALHGLGREALEMFGQMEKTGAKPNDITFIAILSACSHGDLVDQGRWYFSMMRSKYGIEPKIAHYGCMIDLLGRAGLLHQAQEIVKTMPFEANAAIWGSLLAASSIHGDLELAEQALRHLIKLEPHSSGNYSLLSNTYSNVGKWNEARIVRKMMRDTGVKKMAGGSFIEVRNRVHEFIAGDTSHPRFDKINELLQEMDFQIKMSKLCEKEYDGLLELDEI